MADFEVNFLLEYKHLHDAGYNIICYDQRNHSGSENGDAYLCGLSRYEWKDSVGFQQWVDKHPKFAQMKVGLMCIYMSANA